ncbi:MAG: hypothetical protein AB7E85_01510 [Pseudobdellovibrionaceae bacterium]
MFTKTKLLGATAALTLMLGAGMAHAETVVTHTEATTTVPTALTLEAMDTNRDMTVSMDEVSAALFKFYDGDGNEVIDNIEFDNPKVATIRPVDVEKYTFVDFDNDGVAEASSFEYDVMYQRSGLARFDGDNDGLSPAEFLDESFLEADKNNDKGVDAKEWAAAYLAAHKDIEVKSTIDQQDSDDRTNHPE